MMDALEVQRRPTVKKHIRIESTGEFTIGIDVSDRTSCYCILDHAGEICCEGKLRSSPEAYRQQFGGMAPAVIALEAGTHSRWMSALLTECGHQVIVANPRRLRLLTTSDKKNDPEDARTLAEMAWAKPALLSPVRHRSADAQRDLNLVRARDLIVEARTKLINGVRCLVKGFGARVPKCASERFTKHADLHLPQEARRASAPLVELIDELSERIGIRRDAGTRGADAISADGVVDAGFGRGDVDGDGVRVDDRRCSPVRAQPRRGLLFGAAAEAAGLRREVAAAAHPQGRRQLSAKNSGEQCALHYRSVRAGYGSKAMGIEAVRARRQECEEAGGGRGGQETGGAVASAVGDRGSVRTAAKADPRSRRRVNVRGKGEDRMTGKTKRLVWVTAV